jgi:tRNA-specific 2-thiouridylase
MRKQRIAVAMSGGVDSSVAAALLSDKGFDVFGLTMELTGKESRCCADDDIRDARMVAQKLGIRHYVVPMREAFQKNVIDYFVRDYLRGRTPNPCAVCNPSVKFGVLLQKALELGADAFATGHYAVVRRDEKTGRTLLCRAREKGKDQSYFLARLPQKALRHAMFPIGNFPKSKIRELAARFGLPVAQKAESMDACFLPETGLIDFIESEAGTAMEPGPVKDENGRRLGSHRGIAGYTVGQRKGLGVAAGVPVYVNRIDAASNTVVVGPEKSLYSRAFSASMPNWIALEGPQKKLRAKVRIRYRHRPARAWVEPVSKKEVRVRFDAPQRAVTPGQLAVFYDGDVVVGSAWIDEVLKDE